MEDMTETGDANDDLERQSRRGRWKDAISRTKSKFKKEREPQSTQPAFRLSDDVNEFLAAGRKEASSVTKQSITQQVIHDNASAYSSLPQSRNRQPSPRGLSIPRLDISQSQRWPDARTVESESRSRSDGHLVPAFVARQNSGRSHSFQSALARNRTKPRGLSVTFVNAPPTVIGEGGDEAEAPPSDISRGRGRGRDRSQSLSPYIDRPSNSHEGNSNSRSPIGRKPVPHSPPPPPPPPPSTTIQNPEREDSIFQPKPFRRIQTGFSNEQAQKPPTSSTRPLDVQLQQTLKLDGHDRFRDPFVDEPQRRDNHSTPVYAGRQPGDIEQVVFQPTGMLQAHRLSAHSVHSSHSRSSSKSLSSPTSPNVQQSRETSQKPFPPQVRNFYAELTQQNPLYGMQSEQKPVVYSLQESMTRPHPQSELQYHSQLMSSPTDMAKAANERVRDLRRPPSEGWI